METQFDPGEGTTANLPADLVEAHPAAHDQVLDGLLVLAHVGGELLQGGEGRRALIVRPGFRALRQAVEAVVPLRGFHLVLASRHLCHGSKRRSESSPAHNYDI